MIVARRTLTLRLPSKAVPFEVRIHRPELRDGIDYACRVEIDWPGASWTGEAYGADSAQALLLAFKLVSIRLYTSGHHKAGRLVWTEPGKGYGFPVTDNLRDLLVGHDTTL
jgi:hypothetical protein